MFPQLLMIACIDAVLALLVTIFTLRELSVTFFLPIPASQASSYAAKPGGRTSASTRLFHQWNACRTVKAGEIRGVAEKRT